MAEAAVAVPRRAREYETIYVLRPEVARESQERIAARLTEVVGSSDTSVAEAIRTAVRKAAQTVRNIEWFEAKEIRGQVVDGDVAYFQVTVKLGFRVD